MNKNISWVTIILLILWVLTFVIQGTIIGNKNDTIYDQKRIIKAQKAKLELCNSFYPQQ